MGRSGPVNGSVARCAGGAVQVVIDCHPARWAARTAAVYPGYSTVATSKRFPFRSVPSTRTVAWRPARRRVLTALPKYGPARRDHVQPGLRTPAARARPRTARATVPDQLSRMNGRMNAGTWLCTGEQVSCITGVLVGAPK